MTKGVGSSELSATRASQAGSLSAMTSLSDMGSGGAVSMSKNSAMAVLHDAGLVTSTRIGQWTHFRRNEEPIQRFADHLRAVL